MSRFRHFLQGLKPGEIGFCIASVGACSALLLASNKVAQHAERRQAAERSEYVRAQQHVDRLVSEGAPLEGLSTIKFYRAHLREEAKQRAGVLDPTPDELCDEWLRRRNRGDARALQVEAARLKLKRFWHSIEHAVRQQELRGVSAAARGARAEEDILRDLLAGGMDKTQPNDRLILKTIMFLERLDRKHEKMVNWG